MKIITEELGGGFSVMPRIVCRHPGISHQAYRLYSIFVDMAYNKVSFNPTLETLSSYMGTHRITISKIIRELREFGLIKVYLRIKRSNIILIVPIPFVQNLRRPAQDVTPVPRDEQFIDSEADLDKLKEEYLQYHHQVRQLAERAIQLQKTPEELWREKIDGYHRKLGDGDYQALTVDDYCIAFALKYQEVYEEPYVVNWKTDTEAVAFRLLNAGVIGQDAIKFLEQFIEVYDTRFKRREYPFPCLGYLKVEWIYRKFKRYMDDLIEREESERAARDVKIVGTFEM